jgi:Tfp pilus assembly protein PilO
MRQRKSWARTALKIGLLLVALDAVAYVALYRSVMSLLAREQQQFAETRLQWKGRQAALLQVQRRAAALPATEQQVRSFVEKHVPHQREGYSRAGVLIEGLSQRTGVELSGIAFKREDRQETGPFRRLTVNIYVQGPFANLLNFGHGLETASDFIVVRGFKFESGGQGVLGLRLTADLYLMP